METDGEDAGAGRYPPVEMSRQEYERAVARLFSSLSPAVRGLEVKHGERIATPNGEYTIDTTVRYKLFGVEYLTLVEAKLRRRPIERHFVQELAQKVSSAAAHKGILVANTRFQRGAVEFAKAHRIALVQFVDGRLTYETRARGHEPDLGGPAPYFVGFAVSRTETGYGFTAVSLDLDYARKLFPGFGQEAARG